MSEQSNSSNWVVKDKVSGRILQGPMTLDEAQKAQSTLTESSGSGQTEVVQILNG